MKKVFLGIFYCASILAVSVSSGQLPTDLSNVSAGGLLTQLTNAIKPTSFNDKWSTGKSGFLSNFGSVTDAVGLAKGVSSLAGFIKPGMFKQGFNIKNLESTANTAKTISEATGVLKSLESGLKPEALVAGWATKKGAWSNALKALE